MTGDIKVKKSWVLIAAVSLVLLTILGFISFSITPPVVSKVYVAPDGTEFTDYYKYYNYYMQKWGTAPPETPPANLPPTRDASQVQFGLQDIPDGTSVSGTTTEVDITHVANGELDFLTRIETVTVDAAVHASSLYYGQNEILVLHVLSDTDHAGSTGTDHYDTWYWAKLADGEAIHVFTPACVSVKSSSPTYKYTWIGGGATTGYTVRYTSGTTPYWDLGVLGIYPRITAAHSDVYVKANGVTLSAVTDGSTWDTVLTDGANHTMTTTSESMYFEDYAMATDVCYGLPQYTVTQNGEFLERRAVVMFSTNMVSIGTSALLDKGWMPINLNILTAEKAYYKLIDPQIPSRGNKFTLTIEVPIDAASATPATAYTFKFWLIDDQVPAYVAQGSTSTAIPTAYGMCNEYGLDALVFARALTVTTGAGATQVLHVGVTTP